MKIIYGKRLTKVLTLNEYNQTGDVFFEDFFTYREEGYFSQYNIDEYVVEDMDVIDISDDEN